MSFGDRFGKAVLACAGPVVCYLLAPNFEHLARTPVAGLRVEDVAFAAAWLFALIPAGYWFISFAYEAIAGRDSVWFWHPSRD